jgi:hypothetical protein
MSALSYRNQQVNKTDPCTCIFSNYGAGKLSHCSGWIVDWMYVVQLMAGVGLFLLSMVTIPTFGVTQPPIQWVLG